MSGQARAAFVELSQLVLDLKATRPPTHIELMRLGRALDLLGKAIANDAQTINVHESRLADLEQYVARHRRLAPTDPTTAVSGGATETAAVTASGDSAKPKRRGVGKSSNGRSVRR